MKYILFIALLLFSTHLVISQNTQSEIDGGEHGYVPEQSECLNEQQRQLIIQQLKSQSLLLKSEGRLAFSEENRGTNPLFIWPVQKKQGLEYNSVWSISNYVDHNPTSPNALLDYNCGSRTYDTSSGYDHQGLDIFTWPFSWKQMDNDDAEIIAAAAGQIIAKSDGNFDRSCDFSTITPWNAIYIQHSDGSVAWYGHMKNGSLTTKNVGDTVVVGEYLGIVGSSGVSTGPHLHFEVWQDGTYTQLIDPYVGACNSLNSVSWWNSQKPYTNPGINAVLTHSANVDFNNCPNSETTNESDNFMLNDMAYFYIYLRDQYIGSMFNVKIIRPDGSYLLDADYTSTNDYYASYWWWSRVVDMEGIWQWQATYEGETVIHSFSVGALSIDDEELQELSVYPNPFSDTISINSSTIIHSVTIFDFTGKSVVLFEKKSPEGIRELDLSTLSQGIYFADIKGDNKEQKVIKLLKK
ncbi:peptidoglycan DD-metalloendopeptidase family protein [Winogradskyella aurantia]|uniref:Peptidase M23 domain-containing protein n=1 Tax=Winogradskyella aurantia TaxID=1915063 RepID=A0A265UZP0_9FLAO|nr:peptidoglycan DD-metalloendopeptidase family protein [Winogradskyella aurantia]OZV70766.1 hypothetical protein CA834_01245 [Winogradskyella aurantia]